jgi:hypothetical protein
VSDPFDDDLAALRARAAHDLPSLDDTVRRLHRTTTPRQEPLMSFVTRRPVLAAALAVLFLAIAGPVAYAAVQRISLWIDPEASEEQIEADVAAQLERAGIEADVTAEKRDGALVVGITGGDADPAALAGMAINVPGHEASSTELRVVLEAEAEGEVDEAEIEGLTKDVSAPGFTALLGGPRDGLAAAVDAYLTKAGYEAAVRLEGNDLTIKVTF